MDSLIHNTLTRTYLVHLPPGYTGTTPLPLIIAMHGGFGSATNLQDQSQLSVKADAENFIVVYPEGVKNLLNIRTWNAGWCCGYASNNNIDDVGFINTLLDTLISQFAVDTSRIYATGMSNGGFMSYRLACELSNRIAAIAPVAADLSVPVCNPSRPVPIIQFHSYLDSSVVYTGGIGNGVSNHYNSPHDSVLNAWSLKNNCGNTNDTIVDNSQYTFVQWSNCDCNYVINYYITRDGGHSWPGGSQTAIGDPPSAFINANDLMWDFFQMYSMACDTSTVGTDDPFANLMLPAFPNPSTGIFQIATSQFSTINIYDIYGRLVKWSISSKGDISEIDLTLCPDGVYFLTLESGLGNVSLKRLIKIKNEKE